MDFLKSWIKGSSSKSVDEAPKEVAREARLDQTTVLVDVEFE